ncbi:hypothetical protein F2Q70_00013122 [Brassica cretica]|uniref:Secreted protein n=1 Tax=Brassica cretica TaxID=69181 RepID=A0A8S9M9J2_BRACR|nr:hypothetical protein F2Q70_00013122 [Brassica cretica]
MLLESSSPSYVHGLVNLIWILRILFGGNATSSSTACEYSVVIRFLMTSTVVFPLQNPPDEPVIVVTSINQRITEYEVTWWCYLLTYSHVKDHSYHHHHYANSCHDLTETSYPVR